MSTDCVTATVGSFVADGTTPDADGIVWTVQRIDGWWDSTAVAADREEMQPFGEVVNSVRENGRAIALTLVAHNLNPALPLGAALCFLAQENIAPPFAAVYAAVVLEVTDPVITLHASVRRVGKILPTILGNSVAVKFLIPLLAEDPNLYDASDNPFD